MTALLYLDAADAITSGVQRSVHLHPNDHTKLIKVLRPENDRPQRNNFNGVMDRLMPSTRLRQIRKEYQEYLRYMLNLPHGDFRIPISHMFGFAQTNLGLGCITERVKLKQTTLGVTLSDLTNNGGMTDADLALLNDTIARIFASNLRASDMNPANFVFGQRHHGTTLGPRECVLVDGFGDIHAIPVRSMSRWTNRIALRSSCARLGRNTGLIWLADLNQFGQTAS